ncbi:MAG: HAD family hydrolase [Bacilli bacterium]|nr:HAD family hydrolase [Bacilli bacterium]
MSYKNVIFDLDGTLFDTVVDIQKAINVTLKEVGIDRVFTREDTIKALGRGADYLIHIVLGDLDSEEMFKTFKPVYLKNYAAFHGEKTVPFVHIIDALSILKENGVKLFICTNKPDHITLQLMNKTKLAPYFTEMKGHVEGTKVKPDPHIVDYYVEKYHLDKKETVFVGDSVVDYQTAKNASLPICLCLWGYDDYSREYVQNCDYRIKDPLELLEVVR